MKETIKEHLEAVESIDEALLGKLEEVIELSVADAQHLAAEFVVRFKKDRPALAALALTTDTSALTAAGNDFCYEEVFSRQVEALGNEGDVLFAITTSGTSPNVVKAAESARAKGVQIVSITGEKPSPLGEMADLELRMPSASTARIQECYMLLGHILCGEVENRLFV